MLTLFKNLNWKLISVELPAFIIALLTAENLFKFHSFTLECMAFLSLWYVLSLAIAKMIPNPKQG